MIFRLKHNTFHHERGFTLVELLVVITIVIALAALGFLGLRNARSSADRVTSTRNIAQLQFANTTYAACYDGHVGEVTQQDIKRIDNQGGNKSVFWNASAN